MTTLLPLEANILRSLRRKPFVDPANQSTVDLVVDPLFPAVIQFVLQEMGPEPMITFAREGDHRSGVEVQAHAIARLNEGTGVDQLDATHRATQYLQALGYQTEPGGAFNAALDLYLGRANSKQVPPIIACGCIGFLFKPQLSDMSDRALGVECYYIRRLWDASSNYESQLERRAEELITGYGPDRTRRVPVIAASG